MSLSLFRWTGPIARAWLCTAVSGAQALRLQQPFRPPDARPPRCTSAFAAPARVARSAALVRAARSAGMTRAGQTAQFAAQTSIFVTAQRCIAAGSPRTSVHHAQYCSSNAAHRRNAVRELRTCGLRAALHGRAARACSMSPNA